MASHVYNDKNWRLKTIKLKTFHYLYALQNCNDYGIQ